MMKLSGKIKINPLFYLIIISFLITGLIKYLLIVFLVMLMHELGHLTIAKLFRRKITSITIYPFGGMIKTDALISENIFEDLLISLGGIAGQLILFLAVFFLKQENILSTELYNAINSLNKIIIIFNLLPICPLDGYRILKNFFELFIPFRKTFFFSLSVSILTLGLFALYDRKLLFDNSLVIAFSTLMNIEEVKSIKYILNRFRIERINRTFFYKRKDIKNKNNLYKNKNNYYNGKGEKIFLTEKE